MDIFAQDIPGEWIREVLLRCRENGNNFYLFQTKNPARYSEFMDELPAGTFLCTTLESNREYPRIYNLAPSIEKRVSAFRKIKRLKMISIEPILDFDVMAFFEMILSCKPDQVNIGADSGRNGLPEPPKEKILELIEELEKHTKVVQKKNLVRLLK
jgi:protein gp37